MKQYEIEESIEVYELEQKGFMNSYKDSWGGWVKIDVKNGRVSPTTLDTMVVRFKKLLGKIIKGSKL